MALTKFLICHQLESYIYERALQILRLSKPSELLIVALVAGNTLEAINI